MTTPGLYYNYHWPLSLITLLNDLAATQQADPNAPSTSTLWLSRVWFSQPRPGNDPTGEVLTVNFKVPLQVGEITLDIMRASCSVELWYQDRNNNWIQMRDENYQPLSVRVATSQNTSWYTWHAYVYPVVAKAVQVRATRVYDPVLGNRPYNIGLRNGLIRRNVYTRASGTQSMEDEQDAVGNIITKYVQDWDAHDAIDDNPLTFWRSAPLPDPNAVANLYLDVRAPDGSAQLIDTLYLDPVYINQNLNVYYTVDDTVGTRNISPISLAPDTDENTQWTEGYGLSDVSNGGTCIYQAPVAWGPMVDQDAWIGVEWTPNFDPAAGPAQNPVLFGVWPGTDAVQTLSIEGTATGGTWQYSLDGTNFTANLAENISETDLQTALEGLAAIGPGNVLVAGNPGGPYSLTFQGALAQQPIPTPTIVSALTGGPPTPVMQVATTTAGVAPPNGGGSQYWPRLYYDVGAGEFILEFTNGTTAVTYAQAMSPLFVPNAPVRVVAAWSYDPTPTVFLQVSTSNGTILGSSTTNPSNLPTQISMDGEVGYYDFAGTITATVVKLENYLANYPGFVANPTIYVNPNPVQPDPNSGLIPSTTLDNAIYAVDWTLQDVPTGGSHSSFYAAKTWTPIFANYVTQKGKLYFPQPVMVKYLKLEFSNLTEEAYPVYDSGIQVMYNVFPLSVTQAAPSAPNLLAIASGLMTLAGQVLTGGIGSVNWLNPSTINAAVNSVFGMTVPPVTITWGTAYTTPGGSLPNSFGSTASATTTEVATPWVYRRQSTNTQVLASQQIATLSTTGTASGSGTQTLSPVANADVVAAAMSPAINFSPTSTALPLQGTDVWVVPGQTLALPATVMNGLTQSTQVALNKKPSTSYRLRFNTTCVHQYQIKTVVRDAAIAYFAGIREISAFVTNYIANQDPPAFAFSPYDPNAWSYDSNVLQLPTGPLSTKGLAYEIQNPLFDTTLDNWTQAQGSWSVDPGMGRWQYGSATVIADGTEKELLSEAITVWPEVTPGANFQVTVQTQWSDLVVSPGTQPLQLQANYYTDNGETFVSNQVASIAVTSGTTNMWDTEGQGGTPIVGTFQVPATGNIDTIKLGLVVTPDAASGQPWFDTMLIKSLDTVEATAYIDLVTQSTFSKVNCQFNDSGLVRSDSMWANIDPNNTNISSTQLAWYTTPIPSSIPSGTWGDTFAKWSDSTITWGEPFAVVAINIDPNMTYNNKRVLHFNRAGGAGEAGVSVRQVTNFIPGGLFRIGCVYYYPKATGNQITLRLRRVSDGVFIYETTFDPVVGYFYEQVTDFQEIPESDDQIYVVEFTLAGDSADQIYLNDLYIEIAQIRYYCRLGAEGAYLHDITALRYVDTAIVSTTTPVNEVLVQTVVLSPTAWAYSAVLVPNYLK